MNKRTGILRALTTMVSCVLALGLLVGVTGCGKTSDEDLIRSEVTKLMEVFKNPTAEKLSEAMGGETLQIDSIESYGIDVNEFLVHTFSHFDYTIDNVTVDGDTAVVDLSLTNANMQSALEAAASSLSEEDVSAALSGDDAEKQLMQLYFQAFYNEIEASDDLVTTKAQLKLNKVDDTWDIDMTDIDSFYSAMYGGANF